MDDCIPITVVKPGEPFTPPEPLSDGAIAEIHAGLLIPNASAIHSMAREIRKWRGVPDPDAV
jgi:hypothetical protein